MRAQRSVEPIRVRSSTDKSRQVAADRDGAYEIRLVDDLVQTEFAAILELVGPHRALIVTTPTVDRLYVQPAFEAMRALNPRLSKLVLPCSEATKNLDNVNRVCDRATEEGLDRVGVIVAIGGGVCMDIATVAASMIRRGIRHIRVPTTLMGQVDAGVGIKGGVNFNNKKNYLGCFYPPSDVLIDPHFLVSLPVRHMRCGLAEMVKMGVVCDRELFESLERHGKEFLEAGRGHGADGPRRSLWRSVVKIIEELETNLYENRTHERLADFGHTFSPLLETHSDYALHHGEAVAIDMALSTILAARLGKLTSSQEVRILSVMHELGLPTWSPLLTTEFCATAMTEAALHRGGIPNLVIPTGIGSGDFVRSIAEVPVPIMNDALRRLQASTETPSCIVSAPKQADSGVLVFDVGGTHLRAGLFNPNTSSLEDTVRCATPAENLFDQMKKMADTVMQGRCPETVSVAFPGPITPCGRALAAPTVWGCNGKAQTATVGDRLRKSWPDAEVFLLNDVTAAGIRYLREFGPDLCVVTVSSGIGHKVFLDGRPLTGPNGRGGELGHLRVDFSADAPVCDCGEQGHLGAVASGRAVPWQLRRLHDEDPTAFRRSALGEKGATPEQLDNGRVAAAFRSGDPWAVELIDRMARPLGRGLASVHLAVGVERFLLVGGFALALGEAFSEAVAREAAKGAWDLGQDWSRMVSLGHSDDDACLLGAGLFAGSGDDR